MKAGDRVITTRHASGYSVASHSSVVWFPHSVLPGVRGKIIELQAANTWVLFDEDRERETLLPTSHLRKITVLDQLVDALEEAT